METNKTWQYLQDHNYFLHHRLYNKFEVVPPSYVDMTDIKDKVVMDIGMGYGRHLAWFSKYASKVYGLEINKKIIEEARAFITEKGDIKKATLMLYNECNKINKPLDYVFCRFVFQHIEKESCQNYMNFINKFLRKEGKINLQFRLGKEVKIVENKEPVVEYTLKEIDGLLSNFEINSIEINKNNNIYIIGTKLI